MHYSKNEINNCTKTTKSVDVKQQIYQSGFKEETWSSHVFIHAKACSICFKLS